MSKLGNRKKQTIVEVRGRAPATVDMAPEERTVCTLVPDHHAHELLDGRDQHLKEFRLLNALVVHLFDEVLHVPLENPRIQTGR